MTDISNSKSKIAANFQNAITVQLLPPIGVFWDIENIQVPKGKSATSVVSAIRQQFFKQHREAEFMCVCDISKETRAIIHELNAAQLTVVHINATSKNAADEKLRQCMRRFVDTHGSPATILLISDDVNFATDLSDFRHRHHIRIVLLHRYRAPEPLLACANEHYDFDKLVASLPFRSPTKQMRNRPRDVIVTGLPSNCSTGNIKKCLARISDNCGGKVQCVSKTEAVVSFANADLAERAQKRMDKELVFGQRVSVNFLPQDNNTSEDFNARRSLFKDSNLDQLNSDDGNSCDHSPSNLADAAESENNQNQSEEQTKKPFTFPPPPVLNESNLPTVLKSLNSKSVSSSAAPELSSVDTQTSSVQVAGEKFELLDSQTMLKRDVDLSSDNIKSFAKVLQSGNQPYFCHEETLCKSNVPQKNIGRVSPFLMQSSGAQALLQSVPFQGNQPVAEPSQRSLNVRPEIYPSRNVHFQPIPNYQMLNQSLGFGARLNEPPSYPFFGASASIGSNENGQPPCPASSINSVEFSPVELVITNLDQGIEINEMKKLLQSHFREHVMVLHISMMLQPDGNTKAIVKVPSHQDAQLAIAHLQKRKIGRKRIVISNAYNDRCPPFHVMKSEVISLLKDIPSKRLPLFKFRELYEKRYLRTIGVSELYKMRDAVFIQGESSGRLVGLNPGYHDTPSPTDSESSPELPVLEKPYCERHFHLPSSQGWAEQESLQPLPDVVISLKALSPAVHTLLDSHEGSLPLISFCACYEADIGPLPVASPCDGDGEAEEASFQLSSAILGTSENKCLQSPLSVGVPLEHLIACIAGVEIKKTSLCVKKVQWCENKQTNSVRSVSPALVGPLSTFGREAVDLLKNQPCCLVVFNKFIPVYHHHFGRQCRVSDYGFTKLIELLEAIPHIVQVLGEGQNRVVTLTHRMQVKRFTTDLLRILKSRATKQVNLPELQSAYEQCMEKGFNVASYGVCDVEDLLRDIPENTIEVTTCGDDKVVALPKRDQTADEVQRTRAFSAEVIELLKHTPTCSMTFNKFIPAYHHHFGKQCRVSDYGFSKLIELFEVIPELEVRGTGEDKVLSLSEVEHNKVMAERLVMVLKAQPDKMIALHMLGPAYVEMHGHVLRPADFGAVDVPDLLRKLKTSIRVVEGYAGSVVTLVDKKFIQQASFRMRRLLMEQVKGELLLDDLNHLYQKRFGHSIDLMAFADELDHVVEVNACTVKLTPIQLLYRKILVLLQEHGKKMGFDSFMESYTSRFNESLHLSEYNFPTLAALLSSVPEYFHLKGRNKNRAIHLNKNLCETPLPDYIEKRHSDASTITMSSDQLYLRSGIREDILNDPVPSCVPPPTLAPKREEYDLIGFESPIPFMTELTQQISPREQRPTSIRRFLPAVTDMSVMPAAKCLSSDSGWFSAFPHGACTFLLPYGNSVPESSRPFSSIVPHVLNNSIYAQASPSIPTYFHQPSPLPMNSSSAGKLDPAATKSSVQSVREGGLSNVEQTKKAFGPGAAAAFHGSDENAGNSAVAIPRKTDEDSPERRVIRKGVVTASRIAANFSFPPTPINES